MSTDGTVNPNQANSNQAAPSNPSSSQPDGDRLPDDVAKKLIDMIEEVEKEEAELASPSTSDDSDQ